MNISVVQHTNMLRYTKNYPSIAAFVLDPAPTPADTEQVVVRGKGSVDGAEKHFSFSYIVEGDAPVSVKGVWQNDTLMLDYGTSHMVFALGQTSSFAHQTAAGPLAMQVLTKEISLMQKNGAFLLTLTYLALTDGLVQQNTLRFKFTPNR